MRWDLVESSLRDSPKGSRSLLGTRREIARKKTAGLVTIMLKAVGLCGRLTMTGAMELQPDDGPRSSLSIRLEFGRCSGISSEFTRRFAEGIRKLTGSTPGDRREKIKKLAVSMPEATGLSEVRS
ncbi:hypothetical protein GW17_00061164 [Ensete ventricosum]|nr:hypothetical protein GW17_00061164 [Ensete ventricosum]